MNREQAIREMAYRMWEQAGRPGGRDLEFWLQAEALSGSRREVPAAARPMAAAGATDSLSADRKRHTPPRRPPTPKG